MIITDAYVRNFLGIGNAEIRFGKSGLTQIVGKNHDSPSSESNGAGKSSIFESIFWGLYGITKRGLKGDEVVNRHAPKGAGCHVQIGFRLGGDAYVVQRYRDDKDCGNALRFFQSGTDITKGTSAETQKLINDTIKISPLTFSKIAYFGQEDIRPFASLRDSELKEVFEQALGVESLKTHFIKASTYRNVLKADIEKYEREWKAVDERIVGMKETLKLAVDAATEWDKTFDARLAEIQEEIVNAYDELEPIDGQVAEAKEALAPLEKSAVESASKVKSHQELRHQLVKKVGDITAQMGGEGAKAELLHKAIVEADTLIRRAKAKVGAPCSECGKVYEPGDISTYVDNLAEKARVNAEKYKGYRDAFGVLKKKQGDLNALLDKLVLEIDKHTAVVNTYHMKKDANTRVIADLNAKKERLTRGIEALKTKAADHAKSTNPHKAKIEELSGDIRGLKEELKAKLKIWNDRVIEEEVAGHLVSVLGNGGLKNYIFSGITPELNRVANEYLAQLDDIEVEISTVKKLKSGELRDKFSINVVNRHGAGSFDGNSGGEKQKVNLAIALAFNRIIRAMSPESPNVMFLDEPFESLDPGSSERVAELCEGLLVDNDVYLITHNQSIKDLVSNTLTVEKKGGFSTIKF